MADLTGTSTGDAIDGTNKSDVIVSGDGTDSVSAGNGSDIVDGGSGSDTIYGGNGQDLLFGGTESDFIYGGNAKDVVYGGSGDDYINSYQDLLGTSDNGVDTIYGDDYDSYADYLADANGDYLNDTTLASVAAAPGNDIIYGGNGSEIIYGDNGLDGIEGGKDTIYAGNGNDRIFGEGGNDILVGQLGSDTLTGGAGDDVFLYNASSESNATTTDTITDFGNGDDVIRIAGANFTSQPTAGDGSSVGVNEIQVSSSDGITTLFIGTDATAGADIIIKLVGTFTPSQLWAHGTDIGLAHVPVAVDDAANAVEDGGAVTINVLANDTDADLGDTKTVTAVDTTGTLGLVTIIDGGASVSYDPGANFQLLGVGDTATDTFRYTVTDSLGKTATAAVIVTIAGKNDGPSVSAAVASTALEDESAYVIDLLQGASDPDASDVLHVANVTGLADGMTLVGDTLQIDPSAYGSLAVGEHADITINYDVVDGNDGTVAQAASITITGADDAPTITSDEQSGSVTELTDSGSGLIRKLGDPIDEVVKKEAGSDVPEKIAEDPENTTLHTASGLVTFSDIDTHDTHSATYLAGGTGYLGSFSLDEVDQTAHSVGWHFSVDDAVLNPLQAGETLTQTYTVLVNDGHGGTASQDVTITIIGANDVPVITSAVQAGAVTEVTDNVLGENNITHTASGAVTFSDADILDTHTATVSPAPDGYLGTFEIDADDSIQVTGKSVGWHFSVSDSALDSLAADTTHTQIYTISVNDGHGGTASQDVMITIQGANDAPVLINSFSTAALEQTLATLNPLVAIADVDNTTFSSATVSITGNFQSGQDVLGFTNNGSTMGNIAGSYSSDTGVLTLTSAGGTATLAEWTTALRAVTYLNTSDTPNIAKRSVTFVVSDGSDNSNSLGSTITVTPVNDAPVASGPITLTPIAEDSGARIVTQADLLANASDVDGPTLGATGLAISSGGGTLQDNHDGTWTYTPALNDDTSVIFSYSVTDGSLSAPGSAVLDITPVNDAPVAIASLISTNVNAPVAGTLTASDEETALASLDYEIVAGPSHGTVALGSGGEYTYTPAPGYVGADSFSFRAADPGAETSNIAVVEVEVAADSESVVGGAEFRVNSFTSDLQRETANVSQSAAALTDGGFVVTWTSNQDGGSVGVYGQRYDGSGNAAGDEFRINTYTLSEQSFSSVAGLTDGGFVATWASSGQDGSGYGIYCQRYDASGNAVGAEFRINTYTPSWQIFSSVAGLTDGGFVATWSSAGQDGSSGGIYGQRYDASGNAVGAEFRINTYTPSDQTFSSVAGLTDGGFVATWTSFGQDGGSTGVYGQRYDASGGAVGAEFRINTYTPSEQALSSVAGLTDGGFVATWSSFGQDGSGRGIYGQRYDVSGNAVGDEFRINTYTPSEQSSSSVAGLTDGGFVVTWESFSQDGEAGGVYGQRYDANGSAVGGEFLVNTTISGDQFFSEVIGLSGGGFAISWNAIQPGSDYYDVYGKVYSPVSGSKMLVGGDGNDVFIGGGAADTMSGGAGNDILVGGGGDDLMTGGTGADTFDWKFGDQGFSGSPAIDTVTDLDNVAESDTLDLRDLLEDENLSNLGNYLNFTYDSVGNATTVDVSPNGDGNVTQQIVLQDFNVTAYGADESNIIDNLLSAGKLMIDA
jgi:VCBS repeat-containing protein